MKNKLLFFFFIGFIMIVNSTQAQNFSQTAVFAGGCFWSMEQRFEQLNGVINVISGFAGGTTINPTYELVASGKTTYVEAIQIQYDPKIISYNTLLKTYWQQIDPTDSTGQFADRGPQYRPVIFYLNKEQKNLAEKSKQALEKTHIFSNPIKTEIKAFTTFYPAEEYHQNYYKKHPIKYTYCKYHSDKTSFLKKFWNKKNIQKFSQSFQTNNPDNYTKPTKAELKKRLTPLQYKVTQQNATEKAFKNAYWDNEKPGIYVDIVSGEPLFSSLDKFQSGTGWPSFTKPLEAQNIVERTNRTLFVKKIEVRSRLANSHLGHLFYDGPPPTGKRYCINSAALKFVPQDRFIKEGYGQYLKLFTNQ